MSENTNNVSRIDPLTSQQSQSSSKQDNSQSGSQGQGGSQGMASMVPSILSQVLDRLSGKDGIISFTFDNLVVDIPRMQGPGGKDMGSAKWTINGTLRIKAGAEQHHSGTTL